MDSQIDLAEIQKAVDKGVPASARWLVRYTSVTYRFRRGCKSPRPVSSALGPGEYEEAWRHLAILGEYSVPGGARPWLTIHARTGKIVLLDMEREDPCALVNSSLSQFIDTFRYLDKHLRLRRPLPRDFAKLDEFVRRYRPVPADAEEAVRAIDPAAFRRSSEWRSLVRAVLKHDE